MAALDDDQRQKLFKLCYSGCQMQSVKCEMLLPDNHPASLALFNLPVPEINGTVRNLCA